MKRHLLLNVGLLSITLKDNATNQEVIEINVVTQIEKDGTTGNLIRTMFNPLE